MHVTADGREVYVAPDDVRTAVTRAGHRQQGTTGSLDDGSLEQVIVNAQAQVDGRLRGRFTVPFAEPVPTLVWSITLDIAAYLATLTYRQEKDIPDSDPVVRRYMRACQLLDGIACGKVVLDGGDGGVPAERAGGGMGAPIHRGDGPMFGLGDFGLSRQGW